MFQIRSHHVTAIAAQQAALFADRMMVHLREIFPAEVERLNDVQLRMFVDKVCGLAEEWQIVEEQHVERLVELFAGFEALRRIPWPEWIKEIVTYPDRPGEEILLRLEEQLFFGEAR
jgi:hypothetical protein